VDVSRLLNTIDEVDREQRRRLIVFRGGLSRKDLELINRLKILSNIDRVGVSVHRGNGTCSVCGYSGEVFTISIRDVSATLCRVCLTVLTQLIVEKLAGVEYGN